MKTRIKDFFEDYGIAVFVTGIAIFFISLIIFIPCEDNTDPKQGSVYVGAGVAKVCDGTTLVYDGEGTQIVLNSPECM